MNVFRKTIIICSAFLLLILFNPLVTRAQSIYYSKQESFDFQRGDYSVVGYAGGLLYTYVASKEGYFLNAYNDSLNLTAKVALDFFPKTTLVGAQFFTSDHHIRVFYQAVQRNNVVQYAALLDGRGLLIGKPQALDSLKTAWVGGSGRLFHAVRSPDKSKIMVYGMDKKNLRATLLDQDLNKIYHRSRPLSKSKSEDFDDPMVDNQGRFYFSLIQTAGRKNYTSTYQLYQLDAEGKTLTRKKLGGENYFYSGIHAKIDQNTGLVYLAGFYSTAKNGNLDGVVITHFDPEIQNFSTPKYILLGVDVRSDVDLKNKKKAFDDNKVRDLIIKNDGGLLIVSENAYSTTRTSMSPGWGYYSWYYNPMYADQTTREYYYNDILILDFNAQDSLVWHRFIRKSQFSQDDGGSFSSYAFMNSGGALVFLYNDFNNSFSQLDVAVVDPDGGMQLQPIQTGNIGNADWLPRQGVQVARRSWLIPVLNRNNLFFAKVDF